MIQVVSSYNPDDPKDLFHYFWGGPLSNFHPINGDPSNTSEKWFMMYKAIYFNDYLTLSLIRKSQTPKETKKLGRLIHNFNEEEWELVRENFMMAALYRKYKLCEEFRELIQKIPDKIFVEASPYDRVWGIGYAAEDAYVNYENWGLNLLGKCLVKLRAAKNESRMDSRTN